MYLCHVVSWIQVAYITVETTRLQSTCKLARFENIDHACRDSDVFVCGAENNGRFFYIRNSFKVNL